MLLHHVVCSYIVATSCRLNFSASVGYIWNPGIDFWDIPRSVASSVALLCSIPATNWTIWPFAPAMPIFFAKIFTGLRPTKINRKNWFRSCNFVGRHWASVTEVASLLDLFFSRNTLRRRFTRYQQKVFCNVQENELSSALTGRTALTVCWYLVKRRRSVFLEKNLIYKKATWDKQVLTTGLLPKITHWYMYTLYNHLCWMYIPSEIFCTHLCSEECLLSKEPFPSFDCNIYHQVAVGIETFYWSDLCRLSYRESM